MSKLNSKSRVWVVSEVFFPDETSTAYIMTQIAATLREKAEVHVLCGPTGYGSIVTRDLEIVKSLNIHRVNLLNLNKNKVIQRLLRLLLLSISFFSIAIFRIKKKDTVLLVTNPAFALPLFSFLKIIKRFKLNILVHDVFPENLIPAGILKSDKSIVYRIVKGLFNWSYAKANKLIVLGRDMKEVVERKVSSQTDVLVIENWSQSEEVYPTEFKTNQLIIEHNLANKIVLLFAGNLGRLQALENYFNVISKINNPLVHFVFVGNGALLDELKHRVEYEKLANVSFWGTFDRNMQNIFLNACHFGVVTLAEAAYGLGVPSKTYNILASGKPILFLGNQNSEISKLIEESQCGISFNWDNEKEIVKFIDNLHPSSIEQYMVLGGKGRVLAEIKFSKNTILNRFEREIL